jgi:hypothetical protein
MGRLFCFVVGVNRCMCCAGCVGVFFFFFFCCVLVSCESRCCSRSLYFVVTVVVALILIVYLLIVIVVKLIVCLCLFGRCVAQELWHVNALLLVSVWL